jgi:hypothetical protein
MPDPLDPYMKRRRLLLMVLLVMFLAACTNVHQCTPSIKVQKVEGCTFNAQEPIACVGTLWTRWTCIFE